MNIQPNTILKADEKLENKYKSKLKINYDLKRTLVSFQANKQIPGYRWYKFKEGFSSTLVEYILDTLHITTGQIIDPFAGSGTTLFVAKERGLNALGIELLPIGIEIMLVRNDILDGDKNRLIKMLNYWIQDTPWIKARGRIKLNQLNITRGAFPKETESLIEKYLYVISKQKHIKDQRLLRFALLCILEETSYTRKDGQYLRWDYRSGRSYGKVKFNKGQIKEFNKAIIDKLKTIRGDILNENTTLFQNIRKDVRKGKVKTLEGSCLTLLPQLKAASYDLLITSPPYCNRYDYTRTYALELALLGVDEAHIKHLRQTMLSCTVENKEKLELNKHFSKNIFIKATKAFNNQESLQLILKYLDQERLSGKLNNPNIVRMIKNYFYEMALIIFDSARILKKKSYFVMVNDNVRYAGINIPVDLILSDIAKRAGFKVDNIWILPTGKGNSSQQMGVHGKTELRKCVYVWRKL